MNGSFVPGALLASSNHNYVDLLIAVGCTGQEQHAFTVGHEPVIGWLRTTINESVVFPAEGGK